MEKKFLEVALEATKTADEIVMKYFNDLDSADVKYKEDKTPVTLADKEAEDEIRKILLDNFPEHEIVAEENEDSLKESEFVWVVDPIDGTIKFSRGIPMFSVQIALLRDYEPILGVTSNPAFDEIYHAVKSEGAYKNGKKISVSRTDSLLRSFISNGNIVYFDRAEKLKNLAKLVHQGKNRGISDAYGYSLVASGGVDVLLEARAKIWDIAASKVIVEEAGGKMTDFEGKEINFNTLDDLQVLTTNGILHDEVVGIMKS